MRAAAAFVWTTRAAATRTLPSGRSSGVRADCRMCRRVTRRPARAQAVMSEGTSHESTSPESKKWRAFRGADGSIVEHLRDIVYSDELRAADALLIGETHDDPISHTVERELLAAALAMPDRQVVLSMEILERDTQLVVDEYLGGVVRESDFKSNARVPFNYDTDYRELIELARQSREGGGDVRVCAPNAPRRYVSLARRVGREHLAEHVSDAARPLLPPLPYAAASRRYARKFARTMAALRGERVPAPPENEDDDDDDDGVPPVSEGMLDAQSLWDSSMAHSIAEQVKLGAGGGGARPLVFHIGGNFHVEYVLRIPEHLAKYAPSLRFTTLVIVPGRPDAAPAPTPRADFVIVTDENEPRSF